MTTIEPNDIEITKVGRDVEGECCHNGCLSRAYAFAAVGFPNGYVDTCRVHAAEALATLINDGTIAPSATCQHGLEYGICRYDCKPSKAQMLAAVRAKEKKMLVTRAERVADLTVREVEAEVRRLVPRAAEVRRIDYAGMPGTGMVEIDLGNGIRASLMRSEYGLGLALSTDPRTGPSSLDGARPVDCARTMNAVIVALQNLCDVPVAQ